MAGSRAWPKENDPDEIPQYTAELIAPRLRRDTTRREQCIGDDLHAALDAEGFTATPRAEQ